MVRISATLAAALTMALAAVASAQSPASAKAPDELPAHLIKVLRTTNKAQTNRYVPKVYDIQYANPYNLFRWVRRAAQIEEGGYYFFARPDENGQVKGGKVVVILPEYMLPGMDEMMALLDRPGLTSASGEIFYYFRPNHRNTADTGFVQMIQAITGNSGDVVADHEANMLLVYAAESKVEDVKRMLPYVDVPPAQVMIEATVYEIRVDNESALGLDYVAWKNGPGRNAFGYQLFSEQLRVNSLDDMGVVTGDSISVLPGHRYSASGGNVAWVLDVPSAFFDFLVVKGKARVMTSAKIAARNRIPASLEAGDTILYYNVVNGVAPLAGVRPTGFPVDPQNTATVSNTSNPFPDNRIVVGTRTTRELTGDVAGVKLEITPVIGENEITLDVGVELVSHTGYDDKGVPQLVERSATSTLQLRDNEQVVLGGYSREVFVQRADKMPWLGSLPYLGWLFGKEGNTTERRQVVIVLTPHVITDFTAMGYQQTQIDAALIKSKALRQQATEVPHTDVGFDQWLMDTGM